MNKEQKKNVQYDAYAKYILSQKEVLARILKFTIAEFQDLDSGASDEEIVEACKLAQADEFIQLMPNKYDTYIEQGGTNVSGGQRQRLCIARAILKRPKILILDDSTSAVDTKTEALIRQAFLEKIPHTTRIIISQRVSSIQDADQILVIEDGKVSGLGTHEELLKLNAMYKETFEAQNKGGDFDEQ